MSNTVEHIADDTVPRPRRRRLRLGDYEFGDGRVYLRKTGNSAKLDLRLIHEVVGWLACLGVVATRTGWLALTRQRKLSIWFSPDVPHPRYMVRIAAMWAGIRIASSPGQADAAFSFEDATVCAPAEQAHTRHLNRNCLDISKSRVATVFETVFGYGLAVDPTLWIGNAVQKSEINGTHDGQMVICPRAALPGYSYQRLVDTMRDDGFAYDLRTHCVGGGALVVWVKRRDPAARFLPPNLEAVRYRPAEIFTSTELDRIARFVQAMGADWCSLDILRDRDGRIYVVDVNKTDAGPIVALPLREKLIAVAILAKALKTLIAPVDLRPERRQSSR